MSEKKKEFRYMVIVSDHIIQRMEKMPKKDQKMLSRAIDELSKNPLMGHPMDIEVVPPFAHEKCKKCGILYELWWDRNSNEVFFSVSCHHENSFWLHKWELDEGRKRYFDRKGK